MHLLSSDLQSEASLDCLMKKSSFVMGLYSILQHLIIWDRQDDLEKAPLTYISSTELKNIVKPVVILKYCFEVYAEIHESINMLSQMLESLHLWCCEEP